MSKPNAGQFKKGEDPRRWRKGQAPRKPPVDLLSEVIRAVLAEPLPDPNGQPGDYLREADGETLTLRLHRLVRAMADDPRYAEPLFKWGFGLPPQNVEHSGEGGGPILIRVDK